MWPSGAPRRTFLGEDFGRVSDLTVFAPAVLEQNLVRRVPFLVELRNCPHTAQWQVLQYILDRLPGLSKVWMDAGGNGSHLAEVAWQHLGSSTVERVHIDREWYATNLPIFKTGCEDSLLLCPRDLDVRNDLLSFELIDGIPKLPSSRSTGRTGPRHGDAGIALVMVYGASRDDSAADWLATYSKKR
jgi:phage FluMu gp28-like protein